MLKDLALSGGNGNRWGEFEGYFMHSTKKSFLSTYYVLGPGDVAVSITRPLSLWNLRIL